MMGNPSLLLGGRAVGGGTVICPTILNIVTHICAFVIEEIHIGTMCSLSPCCNPKSETQVLTLEMAPPQSSLNIPNYWLAS